MDIDSVRMTIRTERPERAINALKDRGIPFKGFRKTRSGYRFSVPSSCRKSAEALPDAALLSERAFGVIPLIRRLKRRKMLVIGMILTLLLTSSASLFIWRIDVTGTKTVPRERITGALREMGITVGSPFWALSPRAMQNELLVRLPELSYAALNLDGTRLTADVREKTAPPEMMTASDAALTAKRFGVVESAVALKGTAAVRRGDAVEPGDELIIPGAEGALGTVTARTYRVLTAEMPRKTALKLASGEKSREYALIFGDFRINFYVPNGQKSLDYDTIKVRALLSFLPIYMEERTRENCAVQSFTLAADTCEAALRARLAAILAADISDGSVLNERFESEVTDETVKVTLYAECLENII